MNALSVPFGSQFEMQPNVQCPLSPRGSFRSLSPREEHFTCLTAQEERWIRLDKWAPTSLFRPPSWWWPRRSFLSPRTMPGVNSLRNLILEEAKHFFSRYSGNAEQRGLPNRTFAMAGSTGYSKSRLQDQNQQIRVSVWILWCKKASNRGTEYNRGGNF